jgi:hypothetical protein
MTSMNDHEIESARNVFAIQVFQIACVAGVEENIDLMDFV